MDINKTIGGLLDGAILSLKDITDWLKGLGHSRDDKTIFENQEEVIDDVSVIIDKIGEPEQEQPSTLFGNFGQLSDVLEAINGDDPSEIINEFTQEYADEIGSIAGNVPDIEQQIQNLRTLQQLFDSLSQTTQSVINTLGTQETGHSISDDIRDLSAKVGTDAEGKTIFEKFDEMPSEESMKNLYSAHFEQNEDGEETYTCVLPLVAEIEETEEDTIVTI